MNTEEAAAEVRFKHFFSVGGKVFCVCVRFLLRLFVFVNSCFFCQQIPDEPPVYATSFYDPIDLGYQKSLICVRELT